MVRVRLTTGSSAGGLSSQDIKILEAIEQDLAYKKGEEFVSILNHTVDLDKKDADYLISKNLAVLESNYKTLLSADRHLKLIDIDKDILLLNRDEVLGNIRRDLERIAERLASNAISVPDLLYSAESPDVDILVYSPFISKSEVQRFLKMKELKDAIDEGAEGKVVTRSVPEYEEHKMEYVGDAIKSLQNSGLEVYIREGFHEKVMYVKYGGIYLGSANILSYPSQSDIMVRISNINLEKKVLQEVGLPKEKEKIGNR